MKIGRLIKMVGNQISAVKNEQFKEDNLTSSQLELMFFLSSREGQITSQKDIGEYLGIKHTTTIQLLKRLEEKGYVYRQVNQQNAKYKDVYLTDGGREKLHEARRKLDGLNDMVIKDMSDEEQKELMRLLTKVYENVKVQGDGVRP